ncbi:MAG: sugar transferase, partial [Planctomycetota bacterium]
MTLLEPSSAQRLDVREPVRTGLPDAALPLQPSVPCGRIWGRTAVEVHDLFWRQLGVDVVRRSSKRRVALRSFRLARFGRPRWFMLLAPTGLILPNKEHLRRWRALRPGCLTTLRLVSDMLGSKGTHLPWHKDDLPVTERITVGEGNRLHGFLRDYSDPERGRGSVLATSSRRVAEAWANLDHDEKISRDGLMGHCRRNFRLGYRRGEVDRSTRRRIRPMPGTRMRSGDPANESDAICRLLDLCAKPAFRKALGADVEEHCPRVWTARDARIDPRTRFVGSVWIGRGRSVLGLGRDAPAVLGPAVLWDRDVSIDWFEEPAGSRKHTPELGIEEVGALIASAHEKPLTPPPVDAVGARADLDAANRCVGLTRPVFQCVKRAIDLSFSIALLAVTLPVLPIVAALIKLEDGGPVFYAARRQGKHGRPFHCYKFRSMRQDADRMVNELGESNLADGPQVYVPDDDRVTRIGKWLRRLNIDELPQLWNVIKGEMSLVGPRPSPHGENQYNVEWRRKRLSVRPGVTGLWQVRRTRQPGLDFQEWVKWDLLYVEQQSLRLDVR